MSARSSRRFLLAAALVCVGFYVVWLFLPLLGKATPEFAQWGIAGTPWPLIPGGKGEASIVGSSAFFLGVMLLAQWAFLRPVRQAALHGVASARPRWPAIAAIALIATLLCVGLVATVLEIANRWKDIAGLEKSSGMLGVFGVMAVMWAGWSVMFFVYFRQGDFLAKTESVVRTLIRGSCLELLVAIPTHAWVYRRGNDDCYCARGSYTGLVFGVTALLWAFGPGLVLLFWREKQRREPILQRLCPQCGATLSATATPGAPCPQCARVKLG